MSIQTIANLKTDADSFINDNTARDITPEDVRTRIKDLADSSINRLDDKLLLNLRTYVTTRLFEVGEHCVQAGVLYTCTTNTQGAFNGAHWTAVGASTLDALTDVTILSPSNGQVLKYNSGTSQWENANAPTGSGTTGKLSKFTAAGVIGDSVITELSGLIGIGETTPLAKLHVKGTSNAFADAGLAVYSFAGSLLYDYRNNGDSGFGGIAVTGKGATFYGVGSTSNDIAGFYSGGVAAMTIRGHGTLGGSVGIGVSTPSTNHRFHNKGLGSTSATTNALFENQSGTQLFRILDDGEVNSQKGYWVGGNRTFHCHNSSGTLDSHILVSGILAAPSITSGTDFVAVGGFSANSMTSGTRFTSVGYGALFAMVTGENTTAIGNNCLTNYTQTGNTRTTGVGTYNFAFLVSGSANTGLGDYVGGTGVGTTLNDCTFIGSQADTLTNSISSSIALGSTCFVNASNQFAVGGTSKFINDVIIGKGATATSAQNIVIRATPITAGTNNTAGGSVTFADGQSTGNTAGGGLIFQTTPSGGSGTSVNALVTRMTIKSTGIINMASLTVGNAGLSTGDLYKDTAANILANGDYVVGMKV